jgi:hypothetical protein
MISAKNNLRKICFTFGFGVQLEKTIVMCTNSVIPDFINEIGFTAVGSVTILGLEIEGDSGVFSRSFKKICAKLR